MGMFFSWDMCVCVSCHLTAAPQDRKVVNLSCIFWISGWVSIGDWLTGKSMGNPWDLPMGLMGKSTINFPTNPLELTKW